MDKVGKGNRFIHDGVLASIFSIGDKISNNVCIIQFYTIHFQPHKMEVSRLKMTGDYTQSMEAYGSTDF